VRQACHLLTALGDDEQLSRLVDGRFD
jgi:hypothetical protein